MMKYITMSLAKKPFKKREPWSHKGEYGKLLIIGGSKTFFGAPVLSALTAMRSGCDLVKIAAPERSAAIYSSMSPDLIVEPIPGHSFNNWHTRGILELSEHYDAVLIGPGLGPKREIFSFVHSFLSRISKPCVIDADAIKALALNKKSLKPSFILTPHSKEFSLLTDQEPSVKIKERADQAKLFSKHLNCTILLKGHIDVISAPRETLLNRTGTPEMATGGTGDVLSGMTAAFLARGLSPFQAAASAAYFAGLAGEKASKRFGQGLMATDVIEEIPDAMK